MSRTFRSFSLLSFTSHPAVATACPDWSFIGRTRGFDASDASVDISDAPRRVEAMRLYRQYLAERDQEGDADQQPHKRQGYAERMSEQSDLHRKEQREATA